MRVVRFTTLEALAPWAEAWDRLAQAVPFRSWAWLTTWWQHYGPQPGGPARSLYVLGVFDHLERLVGLAPWYRETTAALGNVVRFPRLRRGLFRLSQYPLRARHGRRRDRSPGGVAHHG